MEINKYYQVVYSELSNGDFETEEMKLKEIKECEGKEIYIFEDKRSNPFVQYNHNGNIDWEFVREINAVEFGRLQE